MLASLRIQNLALIEDLEWNLSGGFVAVTGETGAGKSIILGALKLLLGERADKSLIRTGGESCTVEAVFQLSDARELNSMLEEQGVEPCADSELIVKRVFSHNGAGRQFVNCCPTTLAVLKSVGDSLVDLHGPHDHQSLLSLDTQLGLLDSYADAEPLREAYESCFRALHRLTAEHAELSASESSLEREIDLLKHQVSEIEAANLKPDEEEPLVARYTLASNSRRLTEISSQIIARLSEDDDSVLARLAEVQRLFRELDKIDKAAAEFGESHASAVAQLAEIARGLQQHVEQFDLDPEQLAQLEERVNLFESLRRKYGGTLAEVIAFGERASERLRKIESRGEELERLQREIDAARKKLAEAGAKLGKKRKVAAPKLADDVRTQLRDLGFKKSEFEIAVAPLEKPALSGMESVEFLFAPNPGEPLKPLKAIASSGEISRVMLALKTSLAAQDTIPLLVFDEIDANVGGEIAHSVGAKMKSLGCAHQVLCITHLPQVAALAQSHFVVTKEYSNGRTISRLDEVKGVSRVEEIARMLGGKTDSALAHAKTLLGVA
jgi:DNA repair protein RecN (Recombination protein N)